MHADHHKALVAVLLGPGLDVRQAAQAVDAGVGPEIHQHHFTLQGLGAQRWGIEPLHRTIQRSQLPLDCKLGAVLPGFHHAAGGQHCPIGAWLYGQPIDQHLFQAARGSCRQFGQNSGVQPQGYGRDTGKHGCTQALAQPLPCPQ
ncbi:hypothetical protein D9M71_347590 [compost metagenome]